MLTTEDRGDVTVLRIEHGRVGAMDAELLHGVTDAVTLCERSAATASPGRSPRTSQQTMPADNAGDRGVLRAAFANSAMPSLRRVASCSVRSATRSAPIRWWNSNAAASAHRYSNVW